MPTTERFTSRSEAVPNLPHVTFRRIAHDLLERMYRHLSRKPQSLYDVREGKATPFPAKHVADYRRELAKGADPATLLDTHEAVGVEVERAIEDDPSRIPGRAFLMPCEAHRIEFETECVANAIQLRAADPNASLTTLYDARAKSIEELRALKQLIREYDRRIANKELLDRHVARSFGRVS